MASREPSRRRQPPKEADALMASANIQDKEATELADKAAELEADGRLAEAKLLTRASRHRRVESLKTRAMAAATKAR